MEVNSQNNSYYGQMDFAINGELDAAPLRAGNDPSVQQGNVA